MNYENTNNIVTKFNYAQATWVMICLLLAVYLYYKWILFVHTNNSENKRSGKPKVFKYRVLFSVSIKKLQFLFLIE